MKRRGDSSRKFFTILIKSVRHKKIFLPKMKMALINLSIFVIEEKILEISLNFYLVNFQYRKKIHFPENEIWSKPPLYL